VYEHDSDLSINQNTFSTQQGLSLNLVNALSACNDTAVLNYSNIYLTAPIKANDFATINLLQPLNLSFPTFLALSAFPGYGVQGFKTLYLTLSSNYNSTTSPLTISTSLSDDTDTYFNFIDIDGVNCNIAIADNNNNKYLTVDVNALSCYFTTVNSYVITNSANVFLYSLDRYGFLKLFFQQPNGYFYVLRLLGNTLSAVNTSLYSSTTADIFATTYTGIPNTNFINNFVYYNKQDPSGFEINSQKDIADIPQNHIIHYNYESAVNFVSGAEVLVDFFKAKNFLTNSYTINDKEPFLNSVTQRNYTTITSKQNSEKYNGNLQLNYNYYTKNYTLLPDVATKITMPETLYPYSSINIDDSGLTNNGAYGGQSPVFADKIYKQLNGNQNYVNYNEQNGTYLYSWLYTNTSQLTSYWLDRYYYPKKTSFNVAYSGTSNQIFNYNSALSTFLSINYPKNDFYYYDIRSSLTFEPSASYYYSRVGNKYIEKVIKTLPLYSDTFTKYEQDSFNTDSANSITFSTNYGSLIVPTSSNNSFTMSFDLQTKNLSSVNCNVLFGNNFDEGVTLYKGGLNNIYTPGFFLTTPNSLNFYDKNFNQMFTLNLSGYIEAPYFIIDVINYGFDHLIKVFYYNYQTGNPGFLDFSLTSKVHSLVEFPSLNGKFAGGAISKVYKGNSQVAYTVYALVPPATLRTVTFDYINNTIVSVIDTFVGPGGNGWGSQVSYNNNIINLSGYRGTVVGNYGVSKNTNFIYYKNLSANNEYISLSANNDYFFDILSYDNQLYIQTLNNISVFDQYKQSLGTFGVNTSAVSGFKIDIINDNFQPKLLSFFKLSGGNIGIAKYDLDTMTLESSSATSVPAYNNYYQELLFPFYNLTYYPSPFSTPTNFNTINQINGFSDGDVVVRADLFSGNDYQRKVVANFSANLLQNINQNISLVFDSVNGIINLYNNGILLNTALLSSASLNGYSTSHYLNNNFGIGIPFIDNIPATNVSTFDYASGFSINNFIVYADNLNEDEIKFNYLSGAKIDILNFDVPSGTRNNTDTITSFNRFSIPGRKNNSIKVYVKNLDFTPSQQQALSQIVLAKLQSISPVTTNNFDIIYLDNE